jgi:hypothetical protein
MVIDNCCVIYGNNLLSKIKIREELNINILHKITAHYRRKWARYLLRMKGRRFSKLVHE